jgi:hypothetical protein
MGHAAAIGVARRSPLKRPVIRSPTRALVPLQPQVSLLVHRGRYHTERQLAVAELVYVHLIAVGASVGAAVRTGGWGGTRASDGGGTARASQRGPRQVAAPRGRDPAPRSGAGRSRLSRGPGCERSAISRYGPGGIAAIVTPGALAGAARDRGQTRAGQRGATRSRVTWGSEVTPARAGDFRGLTAIHMVFILRWRRDGGGGDLPDPVRPAARAAAGTTPTGSPAPRCRTPPHAPPGRPSAPAQPGRAGSRTCTCTASLPRTSLPSSGAIAAAGKPAASPARPITTADRGDPIPLHAG